MITVDYGGTGGRAIYYVNKFFIIKFYQLKPKEKVIILLQNISVIKLKGY